MRVASLSVANLRVASLSAANLRVASLSVAIFVDATAVFGLPLSPVELVPVVDVCCVTVGRLPLLSNPIVPMPAAALGTDADSVTCCSVAGRPTPVAASVAVAEVASLDETVTEALRPPGAVEAVWATVAGRVTGGSVVPAATDAVYVQVTTCPAVVHDQPVPAAVPGVTPLGSVVVMLMGSFSLLPVATPPVTV